MRRPVDRSCTAEADAARHNRRNAARSWCHHRSPRGCDGHSCSRPPGHAGTVHLSTMYGGREVSAKWTDAGEILYRE